MVPELGGIRVKRGGFTFPQVSLTLLIRRLDGGLSRGGSGRCNGGDLVFDEGLADDAPRVVLPGVEFFPLEFVKIWAQFVAHALFCAFGHVPHRFDEASKLGGVSGQAVWADQENGNDSDQQKFLNGETKRHDPKNSVLAW